MSWVLNAIKLITIKFVVYSSGFTKRSVFKFIVYVLKIRSWVLGAFKLMSISFVVHNSGFAKQSVFNFISYVLDVFLNTNLCLSFYLEFCCNIKEWNLYCFRISLHQFSESDSTYCSGFHKIVFINLATIFHWQNNFQ